MAGMLEGIRIIDMGHAVAVPAAGAILADWGAEVIKVEPLTGEMARGEGRALGVSTIMQFSGGSFRWQIELHNRNKKGLAVDLKTEPGREIVYQLVKNYDVFMSNYESEALKKLNMDYPTLSQVNPKLVYALLTGYGTEGPDRNKRGFDAVASWARSGMQYMIGDPDHPPPLQRPAMFDRVVSVHIVAGISTALLHREMTGEGQELELSLYHSAVWTIAADIQAALMGQPLPKHDRTRASNPLLNTYRAKDNRWFNLHMPQADVNWPDFCRALDKPDLENDPRFNNMNTREQNSEELIRILDDIFATRTLQDWEKYLTENNCIYGRVQTPTEVTTDPQAQANDFFMEMEHPVAGPVKLVASPIKFKQNPASVRTPAPETGQHTEEILLELGYSWDDIVRFKDQEVIL